METKTGLAITFGMLSLLLHAGAANAVMIAGYVNSGCGEWVKVRKEDLNIDRAAHESALSAFLSGMAVGTKKNFLANSDWQSLALWVDNYCAANPLDTLGIAAEKLAYELMRRKGIK